MRDYDCYMAAMKEVLDRIDKGWRVLTPDYLSSWTRANGLVSFGFAQLEDLRVLIDEDDVRAEKGMASPTGVFKMDPGSRIINGQLVEEIWLGELSDVWGCDVEADGTFAWGDVAPLHPIAKYNWLARECRGAWTAWVEAQDEDTRDLWCSMADPIDVANFRLAFRGQ